MIICMPLYIAPVKHISYKDLTYQSGLSKVFRTRQTPKSVVNKQEDSQPLPSCFVSGFVNIYEMVGAEGGQVMKIEIS